MPIQVTAQLDRDSAVYLAGEAISCKVFVKNIGRTEEEPLAWGSVHVQCERIMSCGDETLKKKNSVGDTNRNQTTSISRSVNTVFSCRPVVLFCELILKAGERREFECVQQLPFDGIPPSFKLVFDYNVKSPIKLIHIPLRVLQAEFCLPLPSPSTTLTNPFLANQTIGQLWKKQKNQIRGEIFRIPSVIDMATEATDCLTAPQRSYSYSMTNTRGRLANFTLYKKAFKLGEDIVGKFVFDGCPVPCFQYTVSVQSVETLVDNPDARTFVTTHMVDHAVCAFWKDAFVKLHIPLSATPTFYTDTVHVKWRLHFEFVTSDEVAFELKEGFSEAPTDLNIETMVWNLDIKVVEFQLFFFSFGMPY
ncbi:unnamed protein product [Anisakis simplex]|uniref:Retrograde Golgi transport protein RGP1 homolog (inferred by orthology to a human protein) n=1 Tax=Anisakis simplex TaxID=6269 RepID=A0A0M3JTI3_ANISI|nr:unnamed protein product [Anisakis simplex]